MAVPVDFTTFVNNHPFHFQMNNLLQEPLRQQKIDNGWSPCAMQISHALNKSGLTVDEIICPSPEMGRQVRYFKSGNWNYMIDVFDIAAYLTMRYGAPLHARGTREQMVAAISGRNGIIRFGTDHIDVWMGDHYHQQFQKDLPDPKQWVVDERGAWAAKSVPSAGILLWDVGKGGGGAGRAPAEPRMIGTWRVTIGDWQGTFVFSMDGTCSWSDGGPKHAGTWQVAGGEVQWSYKDDPKGWVRIFHAKMPIGAATVTGEATINGVNHGYYSMTKSG